MTDDYEYFINKRDDKVYLSKKLFHTDFKTDVNGDIKSTIKPLRIASKIINPKEGHEFIKDGAEVSLRITKGQRHEIIAKFYEDTRGVFTLTIQKYTVETGVPHKAYFTFTGDEIKKLFNFAIKIIFCLINILGTINPSINFLCVIPYFFLFYCFFC